MSDILFLSHRIPFPPNKGDKIRSYHMLKHLAARHRVHLGTFIDDPRDRDYIATLEEVCASVRAIELNPRVAKLLSLTGLLRGEALTASYYRNRRLAQWVRETLSTKPITAVVAYSSGVAQFVDSVADGSVRRIMDFVDVDSEKWRQYAETAQSSPARWVYRREAKLLARLERRIATEFDAGLFASPAEAEFFRQSLSQSAHIQGMSNGVDSDFFDPQAVRENPYADAVGPVIVFTGMMDYRANIEGVTWFATDVFPRIRRQVPQALFYIVGGRPARAVRALDEQAGVHVTGRVPDTRPFIRHAHAAVAPLKIARGIQNKVLEALSMGTPTIGTAAAFEGIDAFPGRKEATASDAEAFAAAVVQVLASHHPACPDERLREFVREHYNWERNLSLLDRLIDAQPGPKNVALHDERPAQARG
jgi:sugar transferase (PEP-CTERM/EpsH1 system associated)